MNEFWTSVYKGSLVAGIVVSSFKCYKHLDAANDLYIPFKSKTVAHSIYQNRLNELSDDERLKSIGYFGLGAVCLMLLAPSRKKVSQYKDSVINYFEKSD